MIETIKFTVHGNPQTAGSKRAFAFKRRDGSLGSQVTDDNPKGKAWRSQVVDAARQVFGGDLLRGPLGVSFTFFRPRPKGHFGTGRNADKLKASAPDHPTTKPDVLKLARCAEDALTGVVWADDAQIVDESLSKRYGEPARMEVVVRVLTNGEL